MAPACTTCHYLGLTSALAEGTVADSVVHVASALRTCGELFMAPCFNSPTHASSAVIMVPCNQVLVQLEFTEHRAGLD